jgi:hypothetical protein
LDAFCITDSLMHPGVIQSLMPRESRVKLWNSKGAAMRTQFQGTGNRISVDPHVPELAVDLQRAW